MAETITLRAYLDEVNNLLARGAATEVISHCRYILQHYPRNIETYRLLAQALLQKAQDQGIEPLFEEAAEVFQRVLGVTPNDYVAHLGLSEIREHENQLDQAIWHMERAYEQIPGNQLLQTALRGLYGKRDGENRVPEKIHLTRGALARQYVNGQLYDQALIELRHALEQNPSRLDLQVMLAETLWESHHPVEAGEMAVRILKKLPDCLPANRILARLWLDNERPSDAQYFLDQVEALDPYAAAGVLQPDTRVPDPNLLTRLDYSTEAQATLSQETPDWIQDLGDLSGADVSSVFQMPSTPSPSGTETPAAPEPGLSIDWFGGQAEEPAEVEDVPDWFAAATGQEAPGPTAPADTDIPDWFSELDDMPEQSAEPASQAPADASWLTGLDTPEDIFGPAAAELEDVAPADADWLADFGALDEQPAAGNEPEVSEGPSAQEASNLEWLIEEEAPSEAPPLDVQPAAVEAESDEDWLADFGALDEASALGSEPEVSEGPSAQEASNLEWLVEEEPPSEALAADVQPAAAEAESDEDWLAGFDEVDVSSFEVVDQQAVDEFDWSMEEPSEPAPPELQTGTEIAAEADWWAESPESAEVSTEEARDEAVETGADMRPSSGFTELLAGIEPTQSASEEPEIGGDPEIMPPEWLAAFADEDSEADQDEAIRQLIEDREQDVQSEEAQQEEDSWVWEEAAEPEEELAAGFGVSSQPVDEQSEAEISEELEPGDIPDWLTEPESDFFAPASEGMQEANQAAPSADDWFSEVEEGGAVTDFSEPAEMRTELSEDALRVAAGSDQADWVDEEPEEESSEEQMAEDMAETDEVFESAEESPVEFVSEEENTPVVEDGLKPEAGEQIEVDEAESEAVLDWLQPQAAEGDWLGAYARSEDEEAKPAEYEEVSSAFEEPEIAPVDDLWRDTDERSASISEVEAEEAVADESETSAFEAEEVALFADEEALAEFDEAPAVSEPEVSQAAEPVEEVIETGPTQTDEASSEAGEAPAWMSDLEPVELDEMPEEEGLLDHPYDPFEGGRPENVPEYRSAGETGILQPDESPDWMAAFGDEEMPIEIEIDEQTESDAEFGDEESLLAALGIEAEEEAETDLESEAAEASTGLEEAEEGEAAPLADEELAPPTEEEGVMPGWLAAITSSATEQFEDLRFEEADTYSSSAEASGVVSESDLDWLAPLGEETDISSEAIDSETSAEAADKPLDLEAIFSGVESLGEEGEEAAVEAEEADFSELDMGDLGQAADAGAEVDEIQSWFEDIPAKSEGGTEAGEVEEEEHFDFEFPETQVAQPDDLAHTREVEEEEGDTPWLEDASVPDDFSFEQLAPRWLRRPKEGDQQASSHEHGTAPGAPDWLRDVFEDDEFDE